jgi:membrane dipeptidase
MYRDLGVLYMTLTHSCHTSWADSSSHPPVSNGLTSFGKEVVKEMNRIGMMVDISHVSHDVMRDVIKTSDAPLFASHSDAVGICNKTRNIPDFVLKEMASGRDGVIMINFWTVLVSCEHSATIEQVADHFDYIAKVAGVDHIGFGADLDGITEVATGLEDVSKYPDLLKILFKRGYSRKELVGFMSGNLLRVLKKTEDVAKFLRSRQSDLHDSI